MIIILLSILNVVQSFNAQERGYDPDTFRTTQEMAIAHGYPCKNYTALTKDGYLLLLFRIPGGRGESFDNSVKNHRQPIIMQHGLLDNSNSYLINEKPSLAYIFADAGYDVWIPNFRGNSYSKRHIHYNPANDSEFWDFSVDELISIDLPCIIKFVLTNTGFEKIHYIGHSMGAGSFIAAASENPEFYSKHIKSFMGMSPATSLQHSEFFARLCYHFPVDKPFSSWAGEAGIPGWITRLIVKLCTVAPAVCNVGVNIAIGAGELINNRKLQVLVSRAPDITSNNLILHLTQQTQGEGFYHYRRRMRGDKKIPYHLNKYPAKNIPTGIMGSEHDRIVSIFDTRWLRNQLNSTGDLEYYKEFNGVGHYTYMLLAKDFQLYEDIVGFVIQNSQSSIHTQN